MAPMALRAVTGPTFWQLIRQEWSGLLGLRGYCCFPGRDLHRLNCGPARCGARHAPLRKPLQVLIQLLKAGVWIF